MQEILAKISNVKTNTEEFKDLYPKLLKRMDRQEFYVLLDKDRIVDKSSIPLIGIQNGKKKVLIFTDIEKAKTWCDVFDNKKNNEYLIAKLTRKQFYDTIIVASVYDAHIITINQGTNESASVFVNDVIKFNKYKYDYEVKIPRLMY